MLVLQVEVQILVGGKVAEAALYEAVMSLETSVLFMVLLEELAMVGCPSAVCKSAAIPSGVWDMEVTGEGVSVLL